VAGAATSRYVTDVQLSRCRATLETVSRSPYAEGAAMPSSSILSGNVFDKAAADMLGF